MMCVMTCSAERGIHQETIESVQKNTQLHETSLTQTAGMGEACFRENIYYRVTGELRKQRVSWRKPLLNEFVYERGTVEYKYS